MTQGISNSYLILRHPYSKQLIIFKLSHVTFFKQDSLKPFIKKMTFFPSTQGNAFYCKLLTQKIIVLDQNQDHIFLPFLQAIYQFFKIKLLILSIRCLLFAYDPYELLDQVLHIHYFHFFD